MARMKSHMSCNWIVIMEEYKAIPLPMPKQCQEQVSELEVDKRAAALLTEDEQDQHE